MDDLKAKSNSHSDEPERGHGGDAAEGEARPRAARPGATAVQQGRFSVQHCPGVVVRAGMVRVGVLGEDDEPTRSGEHRGRWQGVAPVRPVPQPFTAFLSPFALT